MTRSRPRLLVFGIDSASPQLIREGIDRGDLPTLAALTNSGASGTLRSVPNMMTPAAWASFATGCNPAKHGIFFFTERVRGTYAERFINGEARAMPAFWSLLSQQRIPAVILNVPMTYPADPICGAMVSGMDAPSVDAPGFTHPAELAPDLRAQFGGLLGEKVLSGGIGHLVLGGELEKARQLLMRRVRLRTELARHLLAEYPADLLVVVHTEVDSVQHYFWKFMDPRVPGYSEPLARRYGDTIRRIYQEVDHALEATLQAFGPSNVIVMSDHGAGASPGVSDGVPWIRRVLEELGLAVSAAENHRFRAISRHSAAAMYRAINPRLPRPLRRLARRWVPGALEAVKATTKYQPDWRLTKAFTGGAAGDIWVNLRGRDPEGIVEPGDEYDCIRQHIREAFLALRDADSGEPIVEAVDFREEVYAGPFVDRAPDLLIRFRDVVIKAVRLDGRVLRLPAHEAASPREVKSGSHRPEGIVILNGEDVRSGVEITGARLIDLAPTILHWMAQPVPDAMDGSVLVEAFRPEVLTSTPVRRHSAPPTIGVSQTSGYTEEDEAVITERLRQLGYL